MVTHPPGRVGRILALLQAVCPLGVGLLVGGLNVPHDGTVSVEETQLDGATGGIIFPVSHMGILFSAEVAVQVRIFLRTGKFRTCCSVFPAGYQA